MKYRVWARLYYGTYYSLCGIFRAFKEEQAFEYEAFVLAALCGVLMWTRPPFLTSAALLGAWLLVMAFELVNGAVERAFDLIDKERNHIIKAGKDMLSGAVFLMILFNIFLWGVFLSQVLSRKFTIY